MAEIRILISLVGPMKWKTFTAAGTGCPATDLRNNHKRNSLADSTSNSTISTTNNSTNTDSKHSTTTSLTTTTNNRIISNTNNISSSPNNSLTKRNNNRAIHCTSIYNRDNWTTTTT